MSPCTSIAMVTLIHHQGGYTFIMLGVEILKEEHRFSQVRQYNVLIKRQRMFTRYFICHKETHVSSLKL